MLPNRNASRNTEYAEMLKRFLELLFWKKPKGIDIFAALAKKESSLHPHDAKRFRDTFSRHLNQYLVSSIFNMIIWFRMCYLFILYALGRGPETFWLPELIILPAFLLVEKCAATKEMQNLCRLLDIRT